MSCIALSVATLAALSLALFARRRWRASRGRCGGRGLGAHRRFGQARWLRWLFAHVDATPAQERELRGALEDLVRDLRRTSSRGAELRRAIVDALRGEVLDEHSFRTLQQASEAFRADVDAALTRSLGRVHGALDASQRERLADVLGRVRGGGGLCGPYRGATPA